MLWLNPLDRRQRRPAGFPRLAGAFPLAGHVPAMASDLLGLLRHAERSVGPLFWLDMGGGHDELFCMKREVFEAFRSGALSTDHLRGFGNEFFGESLLVFDGPPHRHMRSAMNPPFTPKGIAEVGVGAFLAEAVERRVQRWARRRHVRVLAETRELALGLIFGMMGIAEQELGEWEKHYSALLGFLLPIRIDLPGFPRWRARRARHWLDERLQRIIDAARAPGSSGLVAELARSRDDDGAPLSDRELIDNLRLLAFAGHHTTAATTAWIAAELAQRPAVWRALCDEAAGQEVPRSPKDLKRFPYAEAVFREALRLHPPLAFTRRRAVSDLELAGATVPRDTPVAMSILHLLRDPDLYQRPDEFVPERWLNRPAPPSALELAVFGGGAHFCLGYHVAWMECVQFEVALVRALAPAALRPQLDGPPPRVRYFPLPHPSPGMALRFDRG
jgi:cytochrome P450 family 117 subfamily A